MSKSSKAEQAISVDYLRECFTYDAETGALTWKHRPLSHFQSAAVQSTVNTAKAGRPAGSSTRPYLQIVLKAGGRQWNLYGHRVVWCMSHGAWPDQQIDHADGDKQNNCLSNLRLATPQENSRNRPVMGHSKSGVKGIYKARSGIFYAKLRIEGGRDWSGAFPTLDEAKDAHREASLRHFGPFTHQSVAA